jgi:hypothetical protein
MTLENPMHKTDEVIEAALRRNPDDWAAQVAMLMSLEIEVGPESTDSRDSLPDDAFPI